MLNFSYILIYVFVFFILHNGLLYFTLLLNSCLNNEVHRVRVWIVALAGTKLAKENEPIGKSARIFVSKLVVAINNIRYCAFFI